jgi:hypothetical protein
MFKSVKGKIGNTALGRRGSEQKMKRNEIIEIKLMKGLNIVQWRFTLPSAPLVQDFSTHSLLFS